MLFNGTSSAVSWGRKLLQTNGAGNATGDFTSQVTAPTPSFSFYIDGDGIMAILCPSAKVGDTGVVNGVTYTKRDLNGIKQIANSNPSLLATTCILGITDLDYLATEFACFQCRNAKTQN